MSDPKKTQSTKDGKSQSSGFTCCEGNVEDMYQKIQEFCCGTEKSCDCSAMMKGMVGDSSKKQQD
jgi:hypothetical protein